jgi:hypothetical protein
MRLVLCDKDLKGDIPDYAFTNSAKCIKKFDNWINKKNLDISVFVCFAGWKGLEYKDLKDEHNSFLVSHNFDDISSFVDEYLSYRFNKDMDFFIYEFNTYQDAFSYCIDLQESF